MKKFEINPKVGVGPVRFGMTRSEVCKVLGTPEDEGADREWFLDDFAVDYDENGIVTFIELAESDRFKVVFKRKCLHDLAADAAIKHVSQYADYNADDPELGFSYIFPDRQVSLWRPVIPDAEQDSDDPTGRTFEAIGVGSDGYFSK